MGFLSKPMAVTLLRVFSLAISEIPDISLNS